jgi:hypothetical protein
MSERDSAHERQSFIPLFSNHLYKKHQYPGQQAALTPVADNYFQQENTEVTFKGILARGHSVLTTPVN